MATTPELQATFLRALRGDLGPLPPGPQTLPREEIAAAHRRRIIAGMATALAANGLGRTTVADVVREAQVSRRTFYELFADKTSCLLATYDACWDLTMRWVEAAVAPDDQPWRERVGSGVRAYLQVVGAMPGLARVFVVEMPSAGPEAHSHTREVHARFAVLLSHLVDEHRADLPPGADLDALTATAIVGGINELVLQALANGREPHTAEIERTAMRLVFGAMMPPLEP